MFMIDRHYYLFNEQVRIKILPQTEVLDYKGNGSTKREERELVEIERK